jgi:hypothetical protein
LREIPSAGRHRRPGSRPPCELRLDDPARVQNGIAMEDHLALLNALEGRHEPTFTHQTEQDLGPARIPADHRPDVRGRQPALSERLLDLHRQRRRRLARRPRRAKSAAPDRARLPDDPLAADQARHEVVEDGGWQRFRQVPPQLFLAHAVLVRMLPVKVLQPGEQGVLQARAKRRMHGRTAQKRTSAGLVQPWPKPVRNATHETRELVQRAAAMAG